MGKTVAQLLSEISSHELSEWRCYYDLEPFGEERADLRAGIVASTVANTARDPKKRSKPFGPEEFMPRFEPQEQEAQPWEQQLRAVEALNRMFGGRDLREKAGGESVAGEADDA